MPESVLHRPPPFSRRDARQGNRQITQSDREEAETISVILVWGSSTGCIELPACAKQQCYGASQTAACGAVGRCLIIVLSQPKFLSDGVLISFDRGDGRHHRYICILSESRL